MSKQISAWEQHKLDQAKRLLDREVARAQSAHSEREQEETLRRHIAIQPYSAPLLRRAFEIRSKLGKLFD